MVTSLHSGRDASRSTLPVGGSSVRVVFTRRPRKQLHTLAASKYQGLQRTTNYYQRSRAAGFVVGTVAGEQAAASVSVRKPCPSAMAVAMVNSWRKSNAAVRTSAGCLQASYVLHPWTQSSSRRSRRPHQVARLASYPPSGRTPLHRRRGLDWSEAGDVCDMSGVSVFFNAVSSVPVLTHS